MRRCYSHYTFIYPDIYLKNHIVEINDMLQIMQAFPFIKEIEKTEFYSGLLLFIPIGISYESTSKTFIKEKEFIKESFIIRPSTEKYQIIHDENFTLPD